MFVMMSNYFEKRELVITSVAEEVPEVSELVQLLNLLVPRIRLKP